HLLFKNDPDARRRPWLVCQSLCLWTGSVNMVISTFETLPFRPYGFANSIPPFFATDKTLLLKHYLVLNSYGIILYEMKGVVFAYQLPQAQQRSILGQRGRGTPLLPRCEYARVCWRTPPCGAASSASSSPSPCHPCGAARHRGAAADESASHRSAQWLES